MKYKDNATSEERRIIDGYFEGKSPKRLATEYAITHYCRKGEALKIVYDALSKISWGGVENPFKNSISIIRRIKNKCQHFTK